MIPLLAPVAYKFSPVYIAGCQLWLDADRITGLADGAVVTTWTDLSGNGRDATQATADLKPLYKTDIINGKPVVRFDGSNDTMRYSTADLGGNNRTIFVVGKRNAAGSWQTFIAHGIATSGANVMYALTDSATSWGVYTSETVNAGQNANAFKVFAGVFRTANDFDLVTNGTVFTRTTTGKTWYAVGTNYIGWDTTAGVDYLNGDIAEVIAYDTALSVADRQRVERYLGRKYGIAVV